MQRIIIDNPVPTPEEMGEMLGMSPERVQAIRRIMNAPVRPKKPDVSAKTAATLSRKKSLSTRPAKKR